MNSSQEKTDTIRAIYGFSAHVSCIPAFFLNILLFYLIRNKSPTPMKNYRNLLTAPCILDMIIAVWTFIVQPIPIVTHGYHAVVQNGFFQHASQPFNYTANTLWFQFLFIFLCITTLQFVCRYYMAFGNGDIPPALKFGASFIVILLLTAHILLHYWSDYPYAFYQPEMDYLAKIVHDEIGLTNIRFSSFCYARSIPWMLHCLAMAVLFVLCYAIMVYCFTMTQKYFSEYLINKSYVLKNRRKLKYNYQVTCALVIQAMLPTINIIELSIQTISPIFLPGVKTIHFMIYGAIPLYFIPALNPLVTIFLVKPYRKALLHMIPCKEWMPFSISDYSQITERFLDNSVQENSLVVCKNSRISEKTRLTTNTDVFL